MVGTEITSESLTEMRPERKEEADYDKLFGAKLRSLHVIMKATESYLKAFLHNKGLPLSAV